MIREQERYMPIRSLYFGNEESKSGNSFLTHIGKSIKNEPFRLATKNFLLKGIGLVSLISRNRPGYFIFKPI